MNKYEDVNRFLEDTCISVYVTIPFALYTLILVLTTTPTEAHWLYADPILKIFPKAITIWGILIFFSLLFFKWRSLKPLQPQAFFSSLKHILSGILVVALVLIIMRLITGPHMPTFIPAEESAKPGYLLGMAAGLVEELIFRLTLTPFLFFVLRKWLGLHWSVFITIIIVALSFALLHEVGSGAGPFISQHFITRFMIPGVVMGLAVFYISPIFVVTVHCAAHIMIPLLFI